ncbi:DMT family transporter [Rhodohalobacter mucosus]|uniref:EamA/RhaT family transporter n=1 Tax=Rhodohalobacter mucosus TaxID=2079485 RepID=A0A316U2Z6_9BACT|nr:DMT family transporter [Rhodohalobacter mucosus]PWN07716.1 EamA/RhaT family transporter [Rhodohalobacter mucosus]
MKKISPQLLTDLSLLFIAVVWALNFTVIKASLSEIDPYSFNAIRFTLASSFIWLVLAKRKAWFTIPKGDILPLLGMGLAGNLLYQWLFIVGIDLTLAANAAVMLGTIPIWVALFSHLLSMEFMNRLKGVGVLLAFLGVLMIIFFAKNPISFESENFTGDLVIITAAMVWALYTIYSKKFLGRYTPLQYSTIMTTVGAISLALLAIPQAGATDWSAVSLASYAGAGFSGLLAIGVAYLIWNNGIRTVGAVRTATYQNLVPVLGLFFGILLLGESLELLQYLGSGVVIAGILITRHGGRVS